MALSLEAVKGRILDLDSHEMTPTVHIREVFGERALRMLATSPNFNDPTVFNQGMPVDPGIKDNGEITEKTVWEIKRSQAPGAFDFNRRPEVLDAMGIQCQLVFPGMATVAMIQAAGGLLSETSEADRELGWAAIDAHNEWAAQVTNKYTSRLRVVGILKATKPGVTAQQMTQQAAQLIASGCKALFVDNSMPPAGLSPAHPDLDSFYATLAEANVPLVTHPPSGVAFAHNAWKMSDPATVGLGQLTWAAENFVRILTLGGVFERHPTLRFGVIETGAAWIGPLAEEMDFRFKGGNRAKSGFFAVPQKLSKLPSEYLARNVRVTPFNFEPVEVWFNRYPQLQDVYCFSTDYPHEEGMEWSAKTYYDVIAPLGDKVIEKFFYKNAQHLLP